MASVETYVLVMSTEELTAPQNGDPTAPLLADANTAAKMMSIGPSKVYELVAAGHLPGVKISDRPKAGVRIPIAAIHDFILDGGVDNGGGATPAQRAAQSRARLGASSRKWMD